MQRGFAPATDQLATVATCMSLTRFENQRARAAEGDTITVFSVPSRVFGLIPIRRQTLSTDVVAHLARGQSVIAETAVMELALHRGRELLSPRLLPGKQRLDSVAALNAWLQK